MKAVILAGGLGTRISEETSTRPKPMFEIGGRPILWHTMDGYPVCDQCNVLTFDAAKQEGTMRKWIDVSRIKNLVGSRRCV